MKLFSRDIFIFQWMLFSGIFKIETVVFRTEYDRVESNYVGMEHGEHVVFFGFFFLIAFTLYQYKQ